MEPISYFLFNSGLLFAFIALIAFLIGCLLGYFVFKGPDLQMELAEAQSDLDHCREERFELERSLKLAQSQAVAAKKSVAPAIDRQTLRDRQSRYYENQLQFHEIHKDDDYGFIYSRRPERVDDLTEIKGVGEALDLKLNEAGVYTFRQIATWDDETADRFSERLDAFKDRVRRDEWIEQAYELHFKKYGERL